MKVTIDRFEGDYAVVELKSRKMVDLPKLLVPKEAVEGDIIEITVNKNDTEKRRKKIEKLTKNLWE